MGPNLNEIKANCDKIWDQSSWVIARSTPGIVFWGPMGSYLTAAGTTMVPDGRSESLSTAKQRSSIINTVRPEQNGWHVADDIFKYVSFDRKFNVVLIEMSMKYAPEYTTYTMSILFQGMAWRQIDAKPLPEQYWPSSPTYIFITSICILYHCLTLRWSRWLKSFFM